MTAVGLPFSSETYWISIRGSAIGFAPAFIIARPYPRRAIFSSIRSTTSSMVSSEESMSV